MYEKNYYTGIHIHHQHDCIWTHSTVQILSSSTLGWVGSVDGHFQVSPEMLQLSLVGPLRDIHRVVKNVKKVKGS